MPLHLDILETLVKIITPSQIDPQMFRITVWCLGILTTFFIGLSTWILLPVFKRLTQFRVNRFRALSVVNKYDELRSARNHLRTELFKRTRWAREPYQAFHKAWEEARPRGEDKAIIPIRLREFLTPEIVLDGARNRQLAEALPGIFVALGIFGTFLGLVLGLGELEFGKLENLQHGVSHLISGLSLAFLTSLDGIAFSIFFSLVYRILINGLERALMSLDVVLTGIYPYEPHERYARRHYDLQLDIKQGLQTLTTDVATQLSGTIGTKLGEALDNHFVPVMKDFQTFMTQQIEENKRQQDNIVGGFNEHLTRLSKVISQHFDNSQDRQTEAMEAVLKHYSDSLTNTFQKQFEAMGTVIAETTEAQKEIKEQLIDFSAQMRDQFASQGELIDKTNRASEVLGHSLESLDVIADKLKTAVEDISSAATLLESSAITAKEGQDVLRETMEQHIVTMSKTREELDQTWMAVTDNARLLVEQVHHAIQELSTMVGDNLVNALDSFDGKVAEVVERFSGTLFETSQTISEIPALVINMNENISTIKEAISEQKEIVSGLKESSEEVISTNLKIATDATERLSASASKIAESTDGMRSFLESLSETMTTGSSKFREANQSIMAELNRMTNELMVGLHQTQSLLGQDEPLNTALQRFEGYHSGNPENGNGNRLVQLLADPLTDLSQRLDELKETVSQLKGSGSGGETDIRLFNTIAGIDQRIELMPKLIKAAISRLDNLNLSAAKLTSEFEKMQEKSDAESLPDNRWWPFGRSTKK